MKLCSYIYCVTESKFYFIFLTTKVFHLTRHSENWTSVSTKRSRIQSILMSILCPSKDTFLKNMNTRDRSVDQINEPFFQDFRFFLEHKPFMKECM